MEATSKTREKVWKEWKAYLRPWGVPPYLDGCDFQTVARFATMFCGHLRKGTRGKPVGAGSVRAKLGAIGTQIEMDTGGQPLHQRDGVHYIKPIQHMLAGCKNFDPATEKKLACHPDLPRRAYVHGYRRGGSAATRATGDLILIAYYYLLRVGEYTTKARRKQRTRTRQFRMKDVTFYKRGRHGVMKALPPNAPEKSIMTADAATLRISNQKNGHKGQCVHTWANVSNPDDCPIRALGRRVLHIRKHSRKGGALLCSFWDELGHGHVTGEMVAYAVKHAAAALDYPSRGIPLSRINTHSLRAGGACALSLAGYKAHQIMKMGRWAPKSTAFMEYIQQQLSTFSVGMATKMSKIDIFTNMEGAENADDLRAATIY